MTPLLDSVTGQSRLVFDSHLNMPPKRAKKAVTRAPSPLPGNASRLRGGKRPPTPEPEAEPETGPSRPRKRKHRGQEPTLEEQMEEMDEGELAQALKLARRREQ